MHAGDHPDEAESAQRGHHADRAEQRHRAALPRRARRAQIGKGHDHEGERIERRRDAVVKLGADLVG